tara:strand:+ start:1676 stop:2005 length:330 start_codon:yes stop_codon:yes gene_type:complete
MPKKAKFDRIPWTPAERKLNANRIYEVRAHIYPLSHGDVADFICMSRSNLSNLLRGVAWMSLERYEQLMDVDVGLCLEALPDVQRRTKNKLRAIVDEYELARDALEAYF